MEAKREFSRRNGVVAQLKERMLNQTLEEMGSRHGSPWPGKEENLTNKLMNIIHDRRWGWPRRKAMLP